MLSTVNWDTVLIGEDVETQWTTFKAALKDLTDKHIPKVIVKNQRKRIKHPVPLTKKALVKVKRKQRLWTNYLNTKDEQVYKEYCRARNQVKNITRKITKQHEKNISQQAKTNPKKFWKYAQSKTKTKASIPDLYTDENYKEKTNSDQEKAETLSEYFASVYTEENTENMPEILGRNDCPRLQYLEIEKQLIAKKLSQLKLSKSPGPDELHPRILKELCNEISVPLSIIFNNSVKLKYGSIPDDWKMANITAIYKKGDRKVSKNYRPISLTSVVCKTLEAIIRDNIMKHMKDNKLFSKKQFGFISGRSTVLQLIQILDNWMKILDQGGGVDIVFCDFMNAFDKVPHQRLLNKLNMYNIDKPYTEWIKAFLLGRKQRVIVNGEKSDWKDVTSGIPQGSVLGPLLFVIYINDLPSVPTKGAEAYLYADDTKLFKGIFNETDMESLQSDLYEVCKWSKNGN